MAIFRQYPSPTMPESFSLRDVVVSFVLAVLCGLLASPLGAAPTEETAASKPVDFAREVRPILSNSCFHCHGPDGNNRKAGLRLDERDAAFAERDGVRAVVPGKPDESELIARVTASDPADRMPPSESTKEPLTPQEVDTLRRWIEQGAPWEEHWAFVPPVRSEVPTPARIDWARNAIDAFILARLEEEGLSPSEAADRRTLIRRVTFDLTGLPPTLEEVEDFLSDDSPNAYEKVVDRLLDSEHYGEHQARYWLDAARYGDTHGLHLDNYREMWPYRDWVIRAYNRNMPYDQFVTEQLAGDLLPDATLEQKIASGFNRCHVTTSEGGVIQEEVYVRNVVDRVETTGTVFLGLTLGCAVCHDHKFDPIRQKEFYQLFAFFNNMDGSPLDGNRKDPAPVIRVPTDEQERELERLERDLASVKEKLYGPCAELAMAQRDWEEATRDALAAEASWKVLRAEAFASTGGAELEQLDDGSILAGGENPAKEVYEVVAPIPVEGVRAIRLEGLKHDSLPHKGHGRSSNSNVVLTEFDAEVATGDAPEDLVTVRFERAWADHSQSDGDFDIANAIDDKSQTGWATEGHARREDRTAIFITAEPLEGERLRVRLRHESQYSQHQFGRFRLSVTSESALPEALPDLTKEIRQTLEVEPEKRSEEQRRRVLEYYRTKVSDDERVVAWRNEIDQLQKRQQEIQKQIPTTLVMKERDEPRQAYVLIRGEYDHRGDEVDRATPAALPPMDEDLPVNRLGLARWLLDERQPLTARVAVNRMWQRYFGTGLVKTAEDFGNQGEPPSHPELLDWLAVEFRRSGWDMKHIHKLIVMSSTYRQSSRVTEELFRRDPQNRLLARGPRFRLDAEMLRDQALAMSGLLVNKIGGPSVKPPQPDGLWYAVGYTSSNTARFQPDSGEKIYRRSLYTFWKRTAPPPQMRTFDAPSRESCTVRRERTNTPLQALLLMNDPQYVEAARHLAQRALRDGGESIQDRLTYMFRRATLRRPDPDELEVLVSTYRDHEAMFREDTGAAGKLIHVGASKPDTTLDPVELAASTMLANLILNLDEVITKE